MWPPITPGAIPVKVHCAKPPVPWITPDTQDSRQLFLAHASPTTRPAPPPRPTASFIDGQTRRRARSLDSERIIAALEGHRYRLLKDEQQWRNFDHQNVQTVHAVTVKPRVDVLKDRFKQDYFEIVHRLTGVQAAPALSQWQAERLVAGQPPTLQ